ncbi:MAG: PIN domain-containing protein [Verrucomicrobiota bacterium]|nr:PIN domain-containing protein [Verrucomicrobiota bacterium]
MKVLVDTSIWIDHLHRADAMLQNLLLEDAVWVPVPVLGELIAGNIPNRRRTLADLRMMPRLAEPPAEQIFSWIEAHRLGGKGLSWVDCQLLVTAERDHAVIYTHDRILLQFARALKLAFAGRQVG